MREVDIRLNHAKSAKLLERSQKVLAGGVSSEFRKFNYPHALFYNRAKGVYLYDVDGNEYLDFTLSQGPMIVGHSHPHIARRVREYSEKGQLYAGQHLLEIELAEKLNAHIPSAELMRFCLDGSTAIQTALRVARAKTGRNKFIRFEGHYHGWLDNVSWGLTLDGEKMGPKSDPIPLPWTSGMATGASDEFILLPWNDLELVKKIMDSQHHTIAAIVTEPIMCNSGCILPEEGFLEGLRELCDYYGSTLIFDEVITGFRTGLGGAQKLLGITPDLSVFAKALASGYPISAVVGKKEWMQLVAEGKVIHAGTMNSACPLIAAALATIEILEQEGTYERMYALGLQLMEGLREAAQDTGQKLLVQGLGPMFHTGFTDMEKVRDFREMAAYDPQKSKQFIQGLQQRGVRVIGRGLWYISAAHQKEHVEHALKMAREVIRELK